MSFFSPSPPPFDLEEWKAKPHLARLKPLVQDWGENGFGSPTAVYFLYLIKLLVFLGGALLAISTTPGLGSPGDFADWWTEPIVFQKLALWTLLWELLGFGAGSMALSFRFVPPIGGSLYWLRPGTMRLPPWPDRVPFTAGTRRTALDVGLYAAVVGAGVYLLFAAGVDAAPGEAGRMAPGGIAALLALLGLLGLRDKVSFLGSRPEIYGTILAVGLFAVGQWIVAWQFIFLFIWWGAASSKLNRHFPFVVSTMISNAPLVRPKWVKRKLWRDYPEDMRPSRLAAGLAHFGTVQEFGWPLLLISVDNDLVRTIAIVGMILFHLNITSMFPLAVPLEWNLFMIFGILFLFGHYGEVPISTLDEPLLIAMIALICVGLPVLGGLRPDKVSFLPSMRYYAGNWPTTQWLFRKGSGAEQRLDTEIVKSAPSVGEQVTRMYEDPDLTDFLLNKGLSFRAMHSHGRALNGLLPHAVDDVEAYDLRDGEVISNVVNGWNFGDGHFHGRQLLEAVQERCGFAPGELRVIELESEPIAGGRQHYRIFDAATGLLEEGSIAVADMIVRQPWLEESWDFPVAVDYRRGEGEGGAAPVEAGSAAS
ncbi:MAG TPA: DUF3556 domain-containing protein [Solirubrobacterales bacterium]|nr:DUF3556 domain-containing protein [Solirubrobacterales bacterium]